MYTTTTLWYGVYNTMLYFVMIPYILTFLLLSGYIVIKSKLQKYVNISIIMRKQHTTQILHTHNVASDFYVFITMSLFFE